MPANALARVVAIALLSLATVALFRLMPGSHAFGPEMLRNPGLAANLAGWLRLGEVRADGDAALLQNRPGHEPAALYQEPRGESGSLVRIEGDIRVEGVVAGRAPWQRPRLLLVTMDAHGQPRWQVTHMAAAPVGSHGWAHYRVVTRVPTNRHLLVGAQLAAASGKMWVRNLSLRQVAPSSLFRWLSDGLLGLWVIVLAWAAWPVLQSLHRSRGGTAVILTGVAIGLATLMPEGFRVAIVGTLARFGEAIAAWLGIAIAGPAGTAHAVPALGADAGLLSYYLDKGGHFLFHLVLGLVVAMVYRQSRPWPTLAYLAVFAGVTEVLQHFSVDRDPAVSDALINFTGVSLGYLSAWSFRRWWWLRGRPVAADAD